MKKFFFILSVCVVMCVALSSCGNNGGRNIQAEADSLLAVMKADREQMTKYQLVHARPETDIVKIYFKEGESPFFDVSVLSEKSNSVDVYFFKAEDVTEDGRIKSGKTFCRMFTIFIPDGEKLDRWGYGGIDLIRSDYRLHHIDFELVDQPK